MILKIETEISGNFIVEEEMKVKHQPFEIDINYDSTSNSHYISMSKRIKDYARYLPVLKVEEDGETEIQFPSEIFLEEQIHILQHIESFGAIDKEVYKIDWYNCTIEWIPETEEERKELSVSSYKKSLHYSSKKETLSRDWLLKTVLHRRQMQHLSVPFSFYREGVNFYLNHQYQNAFINFYLMIEGCFGDGKHFTNKETKAAYRASPIFEYAIQHTITQLNKDNNKTHYHWLEQTCKKFSKSLDKEGIIHLLIELRGRLSHFSVHKTEKHKNPFKDQDYASLAYLGLMICRFASIQLRLDAFRQNPLQNISTGARP